MKKKIIIFGATGNTGSYITKYALEYFNKEQYEIIVSGRRKTDFFTKRGIPYYSVDVIKEDDFYQLPTENVYAVILLSAQIPSYMEVYKPKQYVDSIIVGAFNVLEYCRKVKADRILFMQTVFDVSLYPHDVVLKSDAKPNFSYVGDHAMYVISKNAAIEMIEHYHQQYGLKKFIFRLPTIYCYSPNPYYCPNGVKSPRPLYQMINKAMKSEPIEIWGDKNYAKDMVYVYDFAQILCKAVEVDREDGMYNIGTGIPITLDEQIHTIVDVFSPKNKPSEIVYRPEKISGGGFLMDINNTVKDLGYKPKYGCKALFEDIKSEMSINRFLDLRVSK
jgi:UDP-glucose 4-epimerase